MVLAGAGFDSPLTHVDEFIEHLCEQEYESLEEAEQAFKERIAR